MGKKNVTPVTKHKQTFAHWEWPIPDSWKWANISEVAEVIGGGTPRTSRFEYWNNGDIPWITPADLTGYTSREISRGARNITKAGLENSSARLLPAGTVLFSSRAPVGYVAIVGNALATNQGFKSFVLSNGMVPAFVYFYLQHAKEQITKLASGTTFVEISARKAAQIPVPVAPSAEQERIVTTLDALLSRIAAGESAVKRARERLKKYREAVLYSAVNGEITRKWRKNNKTTESGTQLLERLLQVRRKRWEEAEYTRLSDIGNLPSGDGWKARYCEPVKPDYSDLPDIPHNWQWASIEQISERVTVGYVGPMKYEYVSSGIPFLRSQNVRPNRFDPNGLLFIGSAFHKKLSKSRIVPGDVVVVRSGSVGVTCVVPEFLSEANCADLVVIQRPLVSAEFISFFMNSVAKRLVNEGKVGVALTHFNTTSVAKLPMTVAPEPEQKQIVHEVRRLLSAADELESRLDQAQKRADQQRQLILRDAFAGKLVPQSSMDEPASILLKRIRMSREIEARKPKPKRMSKSKPQSLRSRRPLLEVLREHQQPITPEQLFRESGFQEEFERHECRQDIVDEFYDELRSIVEANGPVVEKRPDHNTVLLEIRS